MPALPQCLLLTGPRQFVWEDLPPRPLAAGEVGVRTRLSALSVSSELSVVEGRMPARYPCRLGYQTLGVVEAVGPETTLAVGQRVVSTLGHAGYGIHREGALFLVPQGVPDRAALCLILGEETHKGIRKVRPAPGESVLVVGAGLLGLLTVFNLTRRGAAGVTVLEPDPARRERARAFGAAAYAPGELPHQAFAVMFECSASPAGFAEGLGHLGVGGRCAVLSDGNWGGLTLPPEFHGRELSVVASSDGEDYSAYAAWLWGHHEPVLELLFEEEITPDELPATYARLREWPRPVSVLVDWQAR